MHLVSASIPYLLKDLLTPHPHMHLVAQLRASITEAGRKKLTVEIIDADGHSIIPSIEGDVEIRSPEVGVEAVGRLGIGFNNIKFERYGQHSTPSPHRRQRNETHWFSCRRTTGNRIVTLLTCTKMQAPEPKCMLRWAFWCKAGSTTSIVLLPAC